MVKPFTIELGFRDCVALVKLLEHTDKNDHFCKIKMDSKELARIKLRVINELQDIIDTYASAQGSA